MEKTVTRLEAQKRNPHRINVHLDGEYAFSLARIVAAWLSVGQTLSDQKVEELIARDTQEKVYQSALRLIDRRSRSTSEMIQRLTSKGYSEQQIEQTVGRLHQAGLLDDSAFARQWVENRTVFRPRSHRAMQYELRMKGVAGHEIEDALRFAESDEILAYRLGSKYAPRLTGLEPMPFRQKLAGYLGRNGFSYGTIKPVCDRLWQEQGGQRKSDLENEDI